MLKMLNLSKKLCCIANSDKLHRVVCTVCIVDKAANSAHTQVFHFSSKFYFQHLFFSSVHLLQA